MLVSNTAVGPSGSSGASMCAEVAGSSGRAELSGAAFCVPLGGAAGVAGCCCWVWTGGVTLLESGEVEEFCWAYAETLSVSTESIRARREFRRNITSHCKGFPAKTSAQSGLLSWLMFAEPRPSSGRIGLHVARGLLHLTKNAHQVAAQNLSQIGI